jgi:hypothetical protein
MRHPGTHVPKKYLLIIKKLNMAYDDDNSSPQPKQESKMNWGPDWNWIGYMNSFDDENNNGGGGGCGCLSVLIIIGVTVVLLALLGK